MLLDPAALAGTSTGTSTGAGIVVSPLSGVSSATSGATATLKASWVLESTSVGIGETGRPVRPALDTYPNQLLLPGFQGSVIGVTTPIAGASHGSSSGRAGDTVIAGTSAGSSSTGTRRAPSPTLLPAFTGTYPGLVPVALQNTAAAAGQSSGTSSTTGDLLAVRHVASVSNGSSSTSVSASIERRIAVAAAGLSVTFGDLSLQTEETLLAGADAGGSVTYGQANQVAALVGASTGTSDADGDLVGGVELPDFTPGWVDTDAGTMIGYVEFTTVA
jgi:hypothetical protein